MFIFSFVLLLPPAPILILHHKGFGDEYTPDLFILYSLRCITKFLGDIGGLCVSGDESYSMEEMKIAQGLNSEGLGSPKTLRDRGIWDARKWF